MKRYISLLFCLLLILGGCSVQYDRQGIRSIHRETKQLPPADFMPKNITIVSAGDSLTQGVGDIQELGGYIPYLKNKMENNKSIGTALFYNFGVKGNRTDQLLARLKQEQIKTAIEEADLVVITIGGNDVMQVFKENIMGLHLNKFAEAETGYSERLTEIIETILLYNNQAEIILLGIYNPFIKWFSDLKEMETVVKRWNHASYNVVSKYENARFVPVDDIFENNEESLLYTDYFHPNNRGYELIAERIYDYLKEEGKLHTFLE
ncbi:SGNH/GDSL hydrolase family protein [Lederbergia citrea]|uniref:SGNH/GDSL hydrolase family protein n=1 Tax=Lederbergia citrea TaxID=2833581 RepID=A0A942UIJ9_9BACI|nr:SGNH/GDSL hydrolase family protein [Lederbergia citrea]MBS4176642.1 SGNH/GDSL hydrolase family protein [Lederbergia citrea]MBS4203203.1 SGNH/GDSL hydrolase family protein [Lederbergia citrea]MBS4222126.1 SGNH/GDSL hydrolase family protein [Lederbergia citrea]